MKIHNKVLADIVFHVRTQTNLNPWFTATVIPQVVTSETADLAKVVKPVFSAFEDCNLAVMDPVIR